MPNYLKLIIENTNLKLIPVDDFHKSFIIDNNTGNVREFFIPFESEQEVSKWIAEQQEKMKTGQKIELSILDKKNNKFIGMVSLDNLLNVTKTELRIWISPKFQNKSYGKKSLKLLIDWYKKQKEAKNICYIVDSHNEISKKLVLSLGGVFKKEYTDEYGDNVVEYAL